MKVNLELDTAGGEAAKRAALDVLDRLFGPSTSSAATPAPAAVSSPAPAGPAPVAAPSTPAAPPAPASVAPSPLPVASPAPPPSPAPAAAPAPAGGEASPGGITRAIFSKAVEEYAKVYKPAGTKARFAQLATQFGQPGWINTSSIPVDQLDNVMPWFQVQ